MWPVPGAGQCLDSTVAPHTPADCNRYVSCCSQRHFPGGLEVPRKRLADTSCSSTDTSCPVPRASLGMEGRVSLGVRSGGCTGSVPTTMRTYALS